MPQPPSFSSESSGAPVGAACSASASPLGTERDAATQWLDGVLSTEPLSGDDVLSQVAVWVGQLSRLPSLEDQARLAQTVAFRFVLTGPVPYETRALRQALMTWLLTTERLADGGDLCLSRPEIFATNLQNIRRRLEQVLEVSAPAMSFEEASQAFQELDDICTGLTASRRDIARVTPAALTGWMRRLYDVGVSLERQRRSPETQILLEKVWALEGQILRAAAVHHKPAARQLLLDRITLLAVEPAAADRDREYDREIASIRLPRNPAPWILLLQHAERLERPEEARDAVLVLLATQGPWQPLDDPAAVRIGLLSSHRPLRERVIRLLRPTDAAPHTAPHAFEASLVALSDAERPAQGQAVR